MTSLPDLPPQQDASFPTHSSHWPCPEPPRAGMPKPHPCQVLGPAREQGSVGIILVHKQAEQPVHKESLVCNKEACFYPYFPVSGPTRHTLYQGTMETRSWGNTGSTPQASSAMFQRTNRLHGKVQDPVLRIQGQSRNGPQMTNPLYPFSKQ